MEEQTHRKQNKIKASKRHGDNTPNLFCYGVKLQMVKNLLLFKFLKYSYIIFVHTNIYMHTPVTFPFLSKFFFGGGALYLSLIPT